MNAAWTPRFELGSFGALPQRVRAEVVGRLVEALVLIDRHYLTTHPGTPKLFASGVVFEREPPAPDCNWWRDIAATLAQGSGHCVALASWRVAELREGGERVSVHVDEYTMPYGTEYHVLLVRQNGQKEDPSRLLGMP